MLTSEDSRAAETDPSLGDRSFIFPDLQSDSPVGKPRQAAPASARQALEDARQLVRARRRSGRDRHGKGAKSSSEAASAAAEAVASLGRVAGSNGRDESVTGKQQQATVDVADIFARIPPVSGSRQDEVASPFRKNRHKQQQQRQQEQKEQPPQHAHRHRFQENQQHQSHRKAHKNRGGRGVKTGRSLPRFASNARGKLTEAEVNDDAVLSAEDIALVSAVRATLSITEAQIRNIESKAETGAGGDDQAAVSTTSEDDVIGALPHQVEKPQGWLRVVGLIRRACGGEITNQEHRSGSGMQGSIPTGELVSTLDILGGVGRAGVPYPRPRAPPRSAFELALKVCSLCQRPDGGLEVLRLMRSADRQPTLKLYKAVMDGYDPEKRQGRALFTIQMMTAVGEAGLVPDLGMFSDAMEACARGGDKEGLFHLWEQALLLGLAPDERMYKEVLIAYCHTGKWAEARELALDWRERGMSASYGTAAPEAMRTRLVPPEATCNTALLKAMVKADRLDESLSWLRDTLDIAQDAAASGLAVAGSASGVRVEEAGGRDVGVERDVSPVPGLRQVLDRSSFLVVLSGCSRAGRWKAALEVLEDMNRVGTDPDTAAYNTVLAAFEHRRHGAEDEGTAASSAEERAASQAEAPGARPRWQVALELLARMEERGVAADVVTYNSIMNILRRGGRGELALEVLDGMLEDGQRRAGRRGAGSRKGVVHPDVVTYNTAIAACAAMAGRSGREWERASELLKEMQRRGLRPDLYSYGSAIHACAKAGKPVEALRLLRAMDANQVSPDVIVMTACMNALVGGGMWSEALSLLDEMRARGIVPNERTYKAAIQACGKGGQWQRALEILARLEESAAGATVHNYNSAMTACVTGGEPARALELLDRMKHRKAGVRSATPDVVAYTSAITACGALGDWEETLSLLQEMRQGEPGSRPNQRSYTAAIGACARAGQWEPAINLHEDMISEGLSPDNASFNAVIGAARRGGQHELAMKLLGSMVETGLSPDLVTVTELVSSLSERGLWEEADRVFEIAVRTKALQQSSLDSDFEIDVSGLSTVMAKVKVRRTLRRLLHRWRVSPLPLQDLVFVTGTGGGHDPGADKRAGGKRGSAKDIPKSGPARDSVAGGDSQRGWRTQRYSDRSFSLGKALVDALRTENDPPLRVEAVASMAGCVVVRREELEAWAAAQKSGVPGEGG